MRMIPFQEFELFLTDNFTDIYDWFEVQTIQGLTRAESVTLTQHQHRIHSFVSYSPKDVMRACDYKPYMYLNRDMINDLSVSESSFVIMGACLKMAKILASGSDEDEIYSFAESLAIIITEELNYPRGIYEIMNKDSRYNPRGYPLKKTIKELLERECIDIAKLTFCADYGIKRAGLLWKAHSIDDSMQEFCVACEGEFIDIGRVKFNGQIHSIWFKQKNEYI